MKPVRYLLLSLLLVTFARCTTEPLSSVLTYRFSFETGLEEWTPDGTDLEHNDSTIHWSIVTSNDRATHGSSSVQYTLDNLNDAGKIWLVKSFPVDPGQIYRLVVDFDLASADYGPVNHFTMLCGVFLQAPTTREELTPAYQDNTSNGSTTDVGFRWVKKHYEFTIRADNLGTLSALVGVWGTWETLRTYYVDNVSLTFTLIQ